MAFCEDCPLAGFAAGLLGEVMARKGKRPVMPVKKGKKSVSCAMPCIKIYEELRPGVLMEKPLQLFAKRLGVTTQSLGTLTRISQRRKAK